MKKLIKFLFVALCASLLFSCAKDEALFEEEGEMTLKKASMAPTFVVEPTGVDDTENLKNAFADAMNAGAGSVVQLTEGEFYIDLIEVRDFCGTMKGAGKGKTVVTTIDDLHIDEVNNQNLYPTLLKFVGGDVCVRELTFSVPPGPLGFGNRDWFEGLIGFFGFSEVYEPENRYINVIVDNIEILGQPENVGYGLMTGSDSQWMNGDVPFANIDISVTNSYFANCAWYGACIMMIAEGNVTVGTKNGGNTFVTPGGWSYGNLGIWHFVNTKISVVGNHLQGETMWGRCGGLDILSSPHLNFHAHSPQSYASAARVEHNTFDVVNFKSAAIIVDNRRMFYPDDIPMFVQFKNNRITNSGGKSALRCFQLSGAVIRNNKFIGEGTNGVVIGGAPDAFSNNGLMLGNNFSKSDYSEAAIILYDVTRDWTIVGGNLGEKVLDYGENNIITGFNNNTSEVPLGQTISDNLNDMKRPMHDLKGK